MDPFTTVRNPSRADGSLIRIKKKLARQLINISKATILSDIRQSNK